MPSIATAGRPTAQHSAASHTNHCQQRSHTAHCSPAGKSPPTNHCQQGGPPHSSLPARISSISSTISRVFPRDSTAWDVPLSFSPPAAGSEFNPQMFIIRTSLISMLMSAKMQRLEVVREHSEFLSNFSLPQANPTQPAPYRCRRTENHPRFIAHVSGVEFLLEIAGESS